MTFWLVATGVLLVGGLGPALWLSARDGPLDRLVGLQLTGSVAVLLLLVLSQAVNQSGYLIVPLVLVLLGFAGTLVFARLLRPSR